MTRIENSCIAIINALSIGRGDGPNIVQDILSSPEIVLVSLRPWRMCANTLAALRAIEDRDAKACPLVSGKVVWVCEFGSLDPEISAYTTLNARFGPEPMDQWLGTHLRWRYSSYKTLRNATNRSDTVVHITNPTKISLIRDLLF